jgi:hypothetical protein
LFDENKFYHFSRFQKYASAKKKSKSVGMGKYMCQGYIQLFWEIVGETVPQVRIDNKAVLQTHLLKAPDQVFLPCKSMVFLSCENCTPDT